MARFTFFLGTLLAAAPTCADWVVFNDGQRTPVQAVVIAERAVHITTLAGKRWSVLRDTVDVQATLEANATPPPLEVVTVVEPPPIAAPPPAPPPPIPPRNEVPVQTPQGRPAPPPQQQTIVERERTPLPASETTRPPEPTAKQYRFSIALNGVRGNDTVQFADTNQFELFKEQAQIESVYSDPRPQGFELGVNYRIAGPLAIGATVQRFDSDRSASYNASLPHPFFFDRFRELSGTTSGLSRQDLAVHLDAVLTKSWGPMTLEGFGGPSWFQTRTELLVDVLYDEVFPYNDVVFQGVEGRVFESQPLGFNVGASATFRIASVLGVDFGVRYSEARSKLFVDEGREIELDAGGLAFGAGLRFLFP